MLKKTTTQTEADMASKLDYFIETAEWVADHGDALVRKGGDSMATMFLVFGRVPGENRWQKVAGPYDLLEDAVEKALEIPSCDEQGRQFAQKVREIWASPASDELNRVLDRLINYEDRN